VNFAHHVIAEVVAHPGFDRLLFDMKHTPNDLQIVG
jgi:2-keto-3-deoxy-L-rhamnonate aldolase RhmA